MSNQEQVETGSQKEMHEQKTEIASADVIDLYNRLDRLSIQIWADGGWGVDALLGEQTRTHKDLDIAIQWKDIPSKA